MNLLIVSAHRCFVDGSFGALSNCHFDVSTFFKRSLFSMTHSRVKVIKPIYFFKCYDCFFIVEFFEWQLFTYCGSYHECNLVFAYWWFFSFRKVLTWWVVIPALLGLLREWHYRQIALPHFSYFAFYGINRWKVLFPCNSCAVSSKETEHIQKWLLSVISVLHSSHILYAG